MASVQSVERAFAVLQCLSGGATGVSDVAERIGLPKSTVSRLLSTLVELGAVEPVEGGAGYRIGRGMIDIAAGAEPGRDLVAVARPTLVDLVATVGEDAGLSVLDGCDVCYLDQVSADAPVQLRDWTGERVPAHTVSSGLVMLADLSAAERARVIPRPLARLTTRTTTSPARLRERLATVAAEGRAWVYGEYADDINSVAAPVRDDSGVVVAAVHVHGPSYRFPGDADPQRIAAAVVEAGRRIGDRLAGRLDPVRTSRRLGA